MMYLLVSLEMATPSEFAKQKKGWGFTWVPAGEGGGWGGGSHGSLLERVGVHMGPCWGGCEGGGVSHVWLPGFHMGPCWEGGGFTWVPLLGGWGFHMLEWRGFTWVIVGGGGFT